MKSHFPYYQPHVVSRMLKAVLSSVLLVTTLVACDPVDEADRLIYVKPVSASRNVLIEDFTGQRCVNCPTATLEIERLMAQYGGDTVIAVGIHSGPFAKSVKGVPYSLYTAEGDEYFNYWKVESQPKGVVDRLGTSDYPSWGTIVRDELSKTAPLVLQVNVSCDVNSRQMTVTAICQGTDGNTQGKLQLWVIEDGITAFQYMPDGSTNREYVHNHVFRASVNGTWGTDINVVEGVANTNYFDCTLDEAWVPENLWVVGFVYNNHGVCQATKVKVLPSM
ncbi:MAG: Omp28 family outer membrane lipoprotein [Prevotella sp.]|nr:Omp28 family outer membrane lipoprotein [Prevotella sp.]